MRAASLCAAVSVTAGCGSDAASSRPDGRDERAAPSARFSGRTTYRFDGETVTSHTRGAFDWRARRGFAVESGFGDRAHLVQIGDTCYRRRGRGKWATSRATDVHGLCDAATFENPATIDELMERVAHDWRRVGRATVRGVATTRYAGKLNVGAVRGDVELWVGDDGAVRRMRHTGEGRSYRTQRDYFNFGVDVRIRRPTTGGSR